MTEQICTWTCRDLYTPIESVNNINNYIDTTGGHSFALSRYRIYCCFTHIMFRAYTNSNIYYLNCLLCICDTIIEDRHKYSEINRQYSATTWTYHYACDAKTYSQNLCSMPYTASVRVKNRTYSKICCLLHTWLINWYLCSSSYQCI